MDQSVLIAGRFRLEGIVGSGGFGTVHRAIDLQTHEVVALKLLPRGESRNAERFSREASVLASLCHPGIVSYRAHDTAPEGHYLVMEWLEGETLSARLARGRLPIEDVLALARQVAGALAYVHARNIVHRDIKPSNLFLVGGAPQRTMVLDFGIVRRDEVSNLTGTGVLLGSPGYMAPEQARTEHVVDARADVFSLGCVLYQCLTGQPPFPGEHIMAVLAKVLFDHPAPVRALRADTPPALEHLITRMLAKECAQRPSDAGHVLRALGVLAHTSEATPLPALGEHEDRLACILALGRSSHVAATLSPGEAAQRPERLAEVASASGARVETLADGTLLATFPALLPADAAVCAARTALALRDSSKETFSPPVCIVTARTGIGTCLSSGDILDGAARLLAECAELGGTGILIDETTAAFLETRFMLERHGSHAYLGKERRGTSPVRRILGKPSLFVGRSAELATLEMIFAESAGDPSARVTLVTAPPGIGKSRLCDEFLSRLYGRCEGPWVWRGAGDPVHAGSAFCLIGSAIGDALGLSDLDSRDGRAQRLRAEIGRFLPPDQVERVALFLAETLGVAMHSECDLLIRAQKDSTLMWDQIRLAWLDFVGAATDRGPVLLVLDDLHWGDIPSLNLVDAALHVLSARPFFVLALGRPEMHERFPDLFARRAPRSDHLGPLSRRDSTKLVRGILGDAASAGMVDPIVRRANGNPFFLEEILRAKAWGRNAQLPDTVLAVVEERLHELPETERRALRAASVFGEVFLDRGVEALLGNPASPVLTSLVQREWIHYVRESHSSVHRELAFDHSFLREAAYASLPAAERMHAHRTAATWLEETRNRDALTVAHHFELGGELERASAHYRRAAEQALEGHDLSGARNSAERAIACGARGEDLGLLFLLCAETHLWQTQCKEALAAISSALRNLARGGDAWADAMRLGVWARCALEHIDEADEAASALIAALAEAPRSKHLLFATVQALVHLFRHGRMFRARDMMAAAERAISLQGPLEPLLAGACAVASATLVSSTDLERALELKQGAIRNYEEAGDLRGVCMQRSNSGWLLCELGELEEAERSLSQACALADRLGLEHVSAYALQNLGLVHLRAGRLEQARSTLARARLVPSLMARVLALSCIYEARLALCEQNHAAALHAAEEALALLAETSTHVAYAVALLGAARLLAGDTKESLAVSQRAMTVLASHDGHMDEGAAFIRLVFAEALAASGQRDASLTALADARKRLLAQASTLRAPGRRERFLSRIYENARILQLSEGMDGEVSGSCPGGSAS